MTSCKLEESDEAEAIGVIESLDFLEPVAASSTVLCTKRDQTLIVSTIGDRLRQAREICNLSQSEAAKRLGYSNPSKLSKVESATATNSVPLWLILSASRLYDVSIDFLFGVTSDWETGLPRSSPKWLLEAWERVRLRDLGLLDRVHHEVATVAGTTSDLVIAVAEVGSALTTYHDRNPEFYETPASNTLVSRIAKLEAAAKRADAGLKRFELGKYGRST
jgi:transcriptional regulator with XRE-family HTH domain